MVRTLTLAAVVAASLGVAVLAAAGVALTRHETRVAAGESPGDPAAVAWAEAQRDGRPLTALPPVPPGKSFVFPGEDGVVVWTTADGPPWWQAPLFAAVSLAALVTAGLAVKRLVRGAPLLAAVGLALGLCGGVAPGQPPGADRPGRAAKLPPPEELIPPPVQPWPKWTGTYPKGLPKLDPEREARQVAAEREAARYWEKRPWVWQTRHPDGGWKMPFQIPGPMWVWACGPVFVICVVLHRRKFEAGRR